MASFFTPPFLLSCITLSLLLQIPSYSGTDDYYTACGNLYDCGKIKSLGFPFWGNSRPAGCGYPELLLNCSEGSTFITIENVRYLVLVADPDQHIMKIVRNDYYEQDLCPKQLLNTSLDPQVFQYMPGVKNITLLYGCPLIPSVNYEYFSCSKIGFQNEYAYALWDSTIPNILTACSTTVVVPVEVPTLVDLVNLSKVKELLSGGFEVQWIAGIVECKECQGRGGVCGYDLGTNQTTCYYSKRGDSTPQGPSGTPTT